MTHPPRIFDPPPPKYTTNPLTNFHRAAKYSNSGIPMGEGFTTDEPCLEYPKLSSATHMFPSFLPSLSNEPSRQRSSSLGCCKR